MQESIKTRNFIIAEILACLSFILNTFCVVTGKMVHGDWAPVWLPHFGLVYWLKTILAVAGLFFLYFSENKSSPRYVPIFTYLLLLYSIPIVNSFFTLPFDFFLSGFPVIYGTDFDVNFADKMVFKTRISTQIIWSIPMWIVLTDLLVKLVRKRQKI